jgi:dihydroorotate dehydrogenase
MALRPGFSKATRSIHPRLNHPHLRRPTLISVGVPPWAISRARVRSASTAAEATTTSRLVNFFYGTGLFLGLGVLYVYITDTRASAHRWIVIPAFRLLYRDPEEAHRVGNQALKALWDLGLYPRERGDPDGKQDLAVEVFGHSLRNPIATSAGIDKHAEIPDPLFAIGPAIIELGGATPKPQEGNEKPRVFRLTSQNAMINRYGLNSEGADHVAMRLRKRVREFARSLGLGHDEAAERHVLNGGAGVPPGSLKKGRLLAVNIAKNKSTPESDIQAVTEDYVYCVERLAPYADILVVNVSSPNTPGLRTLQQSDTLTQILSGVVGAAKSVDRSTKPAVMVKVSPDEDSEEQIAGICDAIWASGVDGVIVGNTTNRRPKPLPHLKKLSPLEEQTLLEQGGFSGPHLFKKTKDLVRRYKSLLTDKPKDASSPVRPTSALEKEAENLKSSILKVDHRTPSPDKMPDVVADVETAMAEAVLDTEQQSKAQKDRPQSIIDVIDRFPPQSEVINNKPKVIFATGGITNGKQALEVLGAGADVAMVYTALVYGGIGTISRIKDEIRQEKLKNT